MHEKIWDTYVGAGGPSHGDAHRHQEAFVKEAVQGGLELMMNRAKTTFGDLPGYHRQNTEALFFAPGEAPGRFFHTAYLVLPVLTQDGVQQHYLTVDGFPVMNSNDMPVSPLQSLDGVVRVMESAHSFPPDEVTE